MKKGWVTKKLMTLGEIQTGTTPSTKHKEFYGDFIPFIKPPHFNNDGSIEYGNLGLSKQGLQKGRLIKENSVLMVCIGATIGKTGMNTIPVSCNQQINALTPNSNLYPKFFYYLLSSSIFYDEVIRNSSQATLPMINKTKWQNLEVTFPESLEEQKQIVAILDKAFASIDQAQDNIEKNIANAKELFQSKLNEIFSQKGEGWEEKTLGEVCEYDKTKYANNNRPYVGLEHIESNTGNFIGKLEPHNVKSSTFQFDNRHILYGRLRPYLNKVLVPNFKGHCSTEIFPILTKKNLDRNFLFYWFLTPKTVSKIDATWTGARMPRANMNEVIKIKLSIPKIEKQKQIVEQLNQLKEKTNKIESHYHQKLTNLEELKKSILQKAFSGQLSKPIIK